MFVAIMGKRLHIGFLLNAVFFYLITYYSVLGDLQPLFNRPVRFITGMYPGNQNPGGNVQGANQFAPSDNIKNPERPQLESIYRGKVVWGNISATDLDKKDEYIYQQGYNPDRDRDKFGNPIIPSEEIKRRPRPRVQPKRKEDVQEGKLRKKRAHIEDLYDVTKTTNAQAHFNGDGTPIINENQRANTENTTATFSFDQKIKLNEFNRNQDKINDFIDINLDKSINTVIKMMEENKILKKREVRNEQEGVDDLILEQHVIEKRNIVNKIDSNDVILDHVIKKRNIKNEIKNKYAMLGKNVIEQNEINENDAKINQHNIVKGPIESRYKGPVIESIYKGPVIESKYNGPVIRSQYTGAQIRSQYQGPIIKSEYKGKVIAIHKQYAHELEKADANICQTVYENMAQKYEKMNEENHMMGYEPVKYFKRKNAALV